MTRIACESLEYVLKFRNYQNGRAKLFLKLNKRIRKKAFLIIFNEKILMDASSDDE